MRSFRFKRILTTCSIACAITATCQFPAAAQNFDFKDWTSTSGAGVIHFDNTSSAGTITGTTSWFGWGAPTGTYGVPTAITSQQFTTEFNSNGGNTGYPIDFIFSPGYAWRTGGELLIGNIQNYFEYTISAWDFSGNPIDVNQWTTPAGLNTEYPSTAPGSLGYFSTNSTNRTAMGFSSAFYVYDTSASTSGGQGGVLPLGGLTNVGRIELTLFDSALAPNGQVSDLILFNVATPSAVPEPSGFMLLLTIGAGMVVLLRRRRNARVLN